MRRGFTAPIVALAGLTAGAMGAHGGELNKWAGRFPTDVVEGRTFFEEPAIRQQLAVIRGPDAVAGVAGAGRGFPIDEFSGVMVAQTCNEANCTNQNATVLVSEDDSIVGVCVFRADAEGASKIWAASGWRVTVTREQTNKNCFLTPPEMVNDFRAAATLAR